MGKEALPSLCPPGIWFHFDLICFVLCLWWIRFSFVDSWARDKGLFLDDHVTLWSDSNPPSLVLNPTESRVFSNRSFSRSRKTPFLLGNSSIPPKPWSDSSILLVGMFTWSLWSCLQNLSPFVLVLILQSSKFPKFAGWKTFLDSVFLTTGWTDAFKLYASDQPVSSFFVD